MFGPSGPMAAILPLRIRSGDKIYVVTPTLPIRQRKTVVAKIIFEYGVTKPISDLPDNSIALDGYVQGPEIDNIGERYSFDHHAGCIRFCTLSTVQQVHLALSLGLLVGEDTKVFANMLDADTVMSVWLLENAWRKGLVQAPHVIQAVTEIGIVDSHGPIFVVHPLHEYGVIAPAPWQREKQTMEDRKSVV